MNINKAAYFFILLVFSVITSCETETPEIENEYLVNFSSVGIESLESFKSSLDGDLGGVDALTIFLQSGFEKVRIEYNTTNADGSSIIASGALLVPTDIESDMSVVSYQHGTLFNEQDAPSYFKEQSEVALASFFASTGVIVAMPDYIGYGTSKNLPHPYEHRTTAASSTVDMLLAVKEYLAQENINTNDNLLLAGYSQGGYTTMSALQLLEQSYATEFNITNALCGAGAYDKTATFREFVANGSSGEVNNNRSYLWVMLTYRDIYNWEAPLSYYFKEPFLSQIEAEGFLAEIDKSINEIMTDEFKNDVLSGKNTELSAGLADNDVIDWTPQTPIKLYHGTADNYVPFINSQNAFNQFTANGVQNVELVPIEGGTHGTSIQTFFFAAFQEVISSRSTQ